LNSPVLRKHIEEWREELELKLMSKGLRAVIGQATDGEKASFQAAKFLVDKGWIQADNRTKRNKEKKDTQHERLKEDFQSDFERMQKHLN